MLQAAFTLHVLASIAYGRFTRARVVTWTALIVGNAIVAITGFVGYVLPWGQMQFWLATEVVDIASALPGGDRLVAWLFGGDGYSTPMIGWPSGSVIVAALSLALLGIDALVMYAGMWRARSARWVIGRVLLIVAVVVAALVLVASVTNPAAAPPDAAAVLATPVRIMPELWLLPLYAILRCPPGKLFGVLLMFAALTVPVVAPSMRAWRFNADWRRWLWWPLCAGLAACWVALGWLGAQTPDNAVIVQSQVLTAFYFAFFLVVPSALAMVRK